MQVFIAIHQHVTDLTARVVTLTKEKESVEARSLHWVDKMEEEQAAEVQRLKGELDQAAKDVEKKYSEHLDEMGL